MIKVKTISSLQPFSVLLSIQLIVITKRVTIKQNPQDCTIKWCLSENVCLYTNTATSDTLMANDRKVRARWTLTLAEHYTLSWVCILNQSELILAFNPIQSVFIYQVLNFISPFSDAAILPKFHGKQNSLQNFSIKILFGSLYANLIKKVLKVWLNSLLVFVHCGSFTMWK